jgi:hypothetical protein
VLNACDACKASRRKCNGNSSCDGCTKRGIYCVYTANKKRGPLPSSKPSSKPRSDIETSSFAAPVPVSQIFDSSEYALLKNFFAVINPAIMFCDEEFFYTGLRTLDSRYGSAEAAGSSGVLACAYMILAVSTKLLGDEPGSQRYFAQARKCMDLAMHADPSQHLVSALLILYLLPPTTASPAQAHMQVR